ncbi:MAG: MATE family efflux transporter [Elusimicrobia bacterium]|nr:MATE family efflux transporter [Elusimicrobiota bacterium]
MRRLLSFRSEMRPVLELAGPIALMQTGMVFFGTVTTLLAGRIGPQAIAGVGLGNSFYFGLLVCASGLLLGLDPLSARAFGAGRPAECARVLAHAVILCLAASTPVFLGASLARPFFGLVGVDPAVADVAVGYLGALRWYVFPALLFAAGRQYLQSMGITRPQLAAVILGNAFNAGLGWLLIFGKAGLPAMGIRGAGWAIVGASGLMLGVIAAVCRREVVKSGWRWEGVDWALMREMLRIGVPAGLQIVIEVGAFSMGTMLMGRIGAVATAAHQIALNLASLTFMVPLGIGHGACVLVGQGLGRRTPQRSARAGYAALVVGAGFMSVMSILFLAAPGRIAGLYTQDPGVRSLCVTLLAAAAAFQVFDGVQVVLTGALRGMGETRIPMAANAVGHWLIGLPVGVLLAFRLGAGALGIWMGFCLGLAFVAFSLLLVWVVRARELAGRPQAAGPHPEESFDLSGGEMRG